jgi:hypothetical protein
MTRHRFILIGLGLITVASLASSAGAGTEPSPFAPEINRLEAIVHNLDSIQTRIDKVLGSPPDDQLPGPDENGAVGRLSAIDHQIVLLTALMGSVVDEVLATPPDDIYQATDVVPALLNVKTGAESIADTVDAYLSCPPDDITPSRFCEALGAVGDSAQFMADQAQTFIGQIDAAAGEEIGLSLIYGDPTVLTEIHCFGLHPWSDTGEIHGGIDLKPPYMDLFGTSDVRKVEVVAPAAGVVDWIVTGTTGAGAESWVVIIKMNAYWYAVLVFEPQSLDSEILLEQEESIDVIEGQQVTRGQRIGDLVVGNVMVDRYPHIHFSFLYKNPDESIQDLFNDPDAIVRSDGTDLAPIAGAGSPWDPQDLGISSTFFCPYVYSTLEAQQAMDGVDRYNVNGELCSCVCAYNSEDGDCGDCSTP